jgi:hypothetical protein
MNFVIDKEGNVWMVWITNTGVYQVECVTDREKNAYEFMGLQPFKILKSTNQLHDAAQVFDIARYGGI